MKTVKVNISDIITDPIGEMLARSEAMKPYMEYYERAMTGQDYKEALAAIASLPLEKRYLFRVSQCLDWALADFDGETIKLDLPYMTDLVELKNKLQLRMMQLRLLLDVLEGK